MSYGKESDFLMERIFEHPSGVFGAALAQSAQSDIEQGHKYLSPKAWQIASRLVTSVRSLLISDDERDKSSIQRINRNFDKNDMPALHAESEVQVDTIPEGDILSWISASTYRDVAVFALWHRARQRHIKSQLNHLKPELKNDTLSRVSYLISEHIFHPKVSQYYDDFYDESGEIRPIDSFLQGITEWSGVYNSPFIGLAYIYNDPFLNSIDLPELHDTMLHEATHGVGDGGIGIGFSGGLTNNKPQRPMEEFFVTHISTIALEQQNPRILIPRNRPETHHVYLEERELFGRLSENIPIELWGYAYMASRYTPRGRRLRKELQSKLGGAFGSWGEFQKFADDYDSTHSLTERSKLAAKTTQELYGSATDEFSEEVIPIETPVTATLTKA